MATVTNKGQNSVLSASTLAVGTFTCSVGDRIVLCGMFNSSAITSIVLDGNGDSVNLTLDKEQSSGGIHTDIWSVIIDDTTDGSNTTVTVTTSVSCSMAVVVLAIESLANNTVDTNNSSTGTGTVKQSGNATPSIASNVMIGCVGLDVFAVGGTWTGLTAINSTAVSGGPPHASIDTGYIVQASATTQQTDVSGTSGGWMALIQTYVEHSSIDSGELQYDGAGNISIVGNRLIVGNNFALDGAGEISTMGTLTLMSGALSFDGAGEIGSITPLLIVTGTVSVNGAGELSTIGSLIVSMNAGMPLFLYGLPVSNISNNLDLSLFSTAGSGLQGSIPLFLEASSGNFTQQGMNLALRGESTGLVSGWMNLVIGAGSLPTIDGSLTLTLHNQLTEIASGLKLFLKHEGELDGGLPYNQGMNLFIERNFAEGMNLYLKTITGEAASGMSLTIGGAYPAASGLDLSIPNTYDAPDDSLTLYIQGY